MSKVKGGGRAKLSSSAEEAIISLLYDSRDRKNPLKPKLSSSVSDGKETKRYQDLSEHDKKKERKRFCKKLLKFHRQTELSNKFNSSSGPMENSNVGSATTNEKQQQQQQQHETSTKPQVTDNGSCKVRIELVEAIYKDKKDKDTKKDSKKGSKKKTSKNKTIPWKEGSTKKTLVLPNNTKVKDVLTQAKNKLKMKKPVRLFIQDSDSKMEIDLLDDLGGVSDGTVIYATTYCHPPQKDKANRNGEETLEFDDDTEDTCAPTPTYDPLESVKEAYRNRSLQTAKANNWKQRIPCNESNNETMPTFAKSLDNLEPLSESRAALPAAKFRSEILSTLDISRVIIISGATGCGKSTQVPQFVLEGMKAIGCENDTNIIVTQPRRVAATSLAKRVSQERNMPSPGQPGSEVGYNVRLSKAVTKDTKLVYCTVGVLLRMMINPLESYETVNDGQSAHPLSNISHIILDEVHERDLNTDFTLTLLRPLLEANKKISLILMSATASAEMFVDYFNNTQLKLNPKVIVIPGRTFPVQTLWLKECEKYASQKMNGVTAIDKSSPIIDSNEVLKALPARSKIDNDFIAKLIEIIARDQWNDDSSKEKIGHKPTGAILVFLPGKGEIDALSRTLYKISIFGNKTKCNILHLHSNLSPNEQWRAFQPVKYGTVKIVLSTNVAETSVTIADVSHVIDTGRVKEMRYNSASRIKELVTVWTSQASSKQRAGRAGRTSRGTCYKLYEEEFAQQMMLLQTSPEILRTPLEELILQVCLLEEQKNSTGVSPLEFLEQAPQPPPSKNVNEACLHLVEIGALDEIFQGSKKLFRLSPIGYHLSHLPMDAKVGKILVTGCILQCLDPALTIAAAMSTTKSIWLPFIPGEQNSSKKAREAQERIIRDGYGGHNWIGGTVKGDTIASIAAYKMWVSSKNCIGSTEKGRRKFAAEHGLDHNTLNEVHGLRTQFRDSLKVSGLLRYNDFDNQHSNDALLTSCCLVAGLYPNVATLMRPSREKRIRGGRLITKDNGSCRPSSSSFQAERIRNASESGGDVYTVFHGKHLTVGSEPSKLNTTNPFLSEINFVSRFAILLFGGQIEIQKNCMFIDEWLKFKVDDHDSSSSEKVSDKNRVNAVLINELKKEINHMMLNNVVGGIGMNTDSTSDTQEGCEKLIGVVRTLLLSESN